MPLMFPLLRPLGNKPHPAAASPTPATADIFKNSRRVILRNSGLYILCLQFSSYPDRINLEECYEKPSTRKIALRRRPTLGQNTSIFWEPGAITAILQQQYPP